MKIQIITVGGQKGPVFSGINRETPDFIYLLHSSETKVDAEDIVAKTGLNHEYIEIDPFDINKIEPKLSKIFKKHLNDEIICNITAGTKPLAITLYSVALGFGNTKVWYIDQNDCIFDLKSKIQLIREDNETSTLDYLDKLGKMPKSSMLYTDFEEKDFEAIAILRSLFLKSPGEFLDLSNSSEKYTHLQEWKTEKGSILKYIKQENCYSFKFHKHLKEYSLSSKNISNLVKKNGWFELEIASLISKWNKVNELIMSVIFPYSSGSDKNEIDIIVRCKNKLFFIECKIQVNDIKDIDKFNSAVSFYGGLSAKKMLITDQKLKPRVKEKCDDYNILTFDLTSNYDLFGGAEKFLYHLLNSELPINNKK